MQLACIISKMKINPNIGDEIMKQYWRAGETEMDVMNNEGHDGEGRVPLKSLKKEWPNGGVVYIWNADNEDSEPDQVIRW